TQIYTFNTLSTGNHTNVTWRGVGTFDQLTIRDADQYGGADNPNGSRYSVQGIDGVSSTTLSLASPHAYFGFWWSAGDASNMIQFYSGSALVAQFTTATLLNKIASSREYYGNPTTGTYAGRNSGEAYAFVNFFGENGTTWDRIVFSNSNNGSGFESDNYTDRAQAYGYYSGEDPSKLPGVQLARASGTTITVIPEPSAMLLCLAGIVPFFRRKR
ncbi:MAG TPA: hypothetical protein VM511_09965, partial [Luteolibacter sp.]|nr:hypothetical protein [Luteolibacter sp.]